MSPILATSPEAGLNAAGVLFILALLALVALGIHVAQRRRSGRTPLNAVIAILAGAALLTLVLGLAGLIVGVVVFGLYELSRVASS